MMMALVTMVLLAILAGELVYQSGVYSSVVFKERDNLRATLLARSGLRLAMLQTTAAKKAKAKAKDLGMGENATITDKIWQTPLVLPPPTIPGLSGIDQGTLDEFKKSLGLDGQVSVMISGSNDRMSLNSLVWMDAGGKATGAEGTAARDAAKGGDTFDPNDPTGKKGTTPSGSGLTPEQKKEKLQETRKAFAETIDGIFDRKKQDDNAFREKYGNVTGALLVGNLLAWMDPDTKEDGDGRGKNEYYSTVQPTPYSPKEAPIATESELPMIKGFDDTIAKLIAENFTVQNTSSLDVNKASMNLISGLIPELTPDALERIEKRRNDSTLGGPFRDGADFWTFVGTLGNYDDAKARFEKRGIQILQAETSYRVVVVAESGMARKTWTADIGPMPPKEEAAPGTNPQQPTQPTQPNPQANPQDGQNPAVKTPGAQSSDSDSLSILYLRAE